jgi:hypothetical protein
MESANSIYLCRAMIGGATHHTRLLHFGKCCFHILLWETQTINDFGKCSIIDLFRCQYVILDYLDRLCNIDLFN